MEIVKLPMIGLSEESAIIAEWFVKKGDQVAVGDKLCSIENGKSTYDVTAEVAGSVLEVLAEDGVELPIETPILAIGEPGEKVDLSQFQNAPQAEGQPSAAPAPAAEEAKPVVQRTQAAPSEDGHIAASPRAKALAKNAGVELGEVSPSGPDGLIVERDVRAYLEQPGSARAAQPAPQASAPAAAAPAPAASADQITYQDVKMRSTRRMIADNLALSMREMAQSSMTTSFDATELLRIRKLFKESKNEAYRGITISDMVMYAVVHSVLKYPFFNAHYFGDQYVIRQFDHVHLGIAVDTENGLMVPTVFNADLLRLHELSAKVKELAAACRAGTISPSLLTGASITVSNMGPAGAETVTPIVNPPQVAIVGICRTDYRVRPDGKGGFDIYQAMPLALTIDHRVSDGTPAGSFMADICYHLEHFTELLA